MKPAANTVVKNVKKSCIKNKSACSPKNTTGNSSRSYAQDELRFLKTFHKCKLSERPHLANSCSREQVLAFCECADNILRGGVPISEHQKKRFAKHSDALKYLADPSIHWVTKKKLLKNQKGGGFFIPLLTAALPALISHFATKK